MWSWKVLRVIRREEGMSSRRLSTRFLRTRFQLDIDLHLRTFVNTCSRTGSISQSFYMKEKLLVITKNCQDLSQILSLSEEFVEHVFNKAAVCLPPLLLIQQFTHFSRIASQGWVVLYPLAFKAASGEAKSNQSWPNGSGFGFLFPQCGKIRVLSRSAGLVYKLCMREK